MEEDPWCQLTRIKEQYRRLKEEHQRLQLEYGNLETEHKQLIDVLASEQADCAKNVEVLQSKNKDLEKELLLLRPHLITKETEDLIKMRAIEEVERRYSDEVRNCVSQIDALTVERNEMRRENDFLKGELANLSESVERTKVEYRQRIDAETNALQRQRDTFAIEERNRIGEATKKWSQLDLENRQLSLRLNSIVKENEELSATLQKLQSECNTMSREFAKKNSNLGGQVSALIAERDCCRQQGDVMSREIASLSESNVRLTSRVHDLERQNGHLQSIIDEMTHNHSMELNNAKLQYLNDRSSLERERTELKLRIKECEAERDSLRHALDEKTDVVIEKERECQHKITFVQEESLKTKTSLEDQLSGMNAKVAECERRARQLEDKLAQCKDQSSGRIDQLLKERDGLSLEVVALKEELRRSRTDVKQIDPVISGSHHVQPQYPPDYFDELKKKLQHAKDKLKVAKRTINELKNSVSSESALRKKLEEKNSKLRAWIDDFCRGHSRFVKILDESSDRPCDKENGGPYGPVNDEVVNMVRAVNEKLTIIEQRNARQLGLNSLPPMPVFESEPQDDIDDSVITHQP